MSHYEGVTIGIFGASGSGKSTLTRELMQKHQRIIVADYMGEYDGHVITCGRDYRAAFAELSDTLQKSGSKPMKIAFRYDGLCPLQPWQYLEMLSKFIYVFQQKNHQEAGALLFVIEEMSALAPSSKGESMTAFKAICNQARHFGVMRLGISQRPKTINTAFANNMTDIYGFSLATRSDVGEIVKFIPPQEKASEQRFIQIPKHEYIHINKNRQVSFAKTKK